VTVTDTSGGATSADTTPDTATEHGDTPGSGAVEQSAPLDAETVTGGTVTVCSSCGEHVDEGAAFCESCGANLTGDTDSPPAAHVDAAVGTVIDTTTTTFTLPAKTTPATPAATHPDGCMCGGAYTDGWCDLCGSPAPNPRNHIVERPSRWVAGVCDRGITHTHNEDGVALSALDTPGDGCVLVVCDGVSTTPGSDIASLAAARAARDILTGNLGNTHTSTAARVATWAQTFNVATDAARTAANATPPATPGGPPPSCTYVAAVVDRDLVCAASIGDSRLYWFPDNEPGRQITVDHSWAQDQIANGRDAADVLTEPGGHAITRWLGADGDTDPADFVSFPITEPGWLLACSDGLWNYTPTVDHLATQLAAAVAGDSDPVAVCETLVSWACAQGGHDNITVAVARLT
jgi:serine/threonine protein phosphatase PrpC